MICVCKCIYKYMHKYIHTYLLFRTHAQHASAYASIRQHTSAYANTCTHTYTHTFSSARMRGVIPRIFFFFPGPAVACSKRRLSIALVGLPVPPKKIWEGKKEK